MYDYCATILKLNFRINFPENILHGDIFKGKGFVIIHKFIF